MRERTKRGLRRLGSGLLALAMALSLLPVMGVTIAQAANGDAVVEVDIVGDDYQTVKASATPYVDGTGSQNIPITVESTATEELYGDYSDAWKNRVFYLYSLQATLTPAGGSTIATIGTSYMAKVYNSDVDYYGTGVQNGFAVLRGGQYASEESPHSSSQGTTRVRVASEAVIPTSGGGSVNWYAFQILLAETPATQFADGLSWGTINAGSKSVTYDFDTSDYYYLQSGDNTLIVNAGKLQYNFQPGPNTFTVGATIGVYNYGADITNGTYGNLGSLISGTSKNGSKTITIYAPYTLTLDLNDGTGSTFSEAVTYANGCYVFPTATPTREGYTFVGWNTKADGTGDSYSAGQSNIKYYKENDGDTLTFNENTTLYAQWLEGDQRMVILKDVYTSSEKQVIVEGSIYTFPTAAEAELQEIVDNYASEFHFAGWALSGDSSGRVYQPTETYDLTGGVTTFVAKRDTYYVVTYDQNLPAADQTLLSEYGDWPGEERVKAEYAPGSSLAGTVTLPDTMFHTQDYVISGWSTSKSGGSSYGLGDTATVTQSTTLYAKWTLAGRIVGIQGCSGVTEGEVITPTIRLYLPSGVQNENTKLTVTYGDDSVVNGVAFSTDTFTHPVGAPDGTYYYTLPELSASIGKEVKVTLNGASGLVMDTKTVTLTAEPVDPAAPDVTQYTVTYLPGVVPDTSDTMSAQSMPSQDKVTENSAYTVNGNTPTASGYTFKGWDSGTDGEVNYQPGEKITSVDGDITLTAVWEKTAAAGQYALTYSAGENVTDAQNIPDNIYVTEGEAFTLSNARPIRPGYTFTGWSDGKNTYQPGAGFADGTTVDLTLTAQWQQIGTVDITYSAGASVTDAVNIPSNTTAEQNSSYTIPSVVPTRKGYTFTGWIAGGKTYQPGDTIAVGTDNITLTAVWSQNKVTITWLPGSLPTGVTGSGWNTTTPAFEGDTVTFSLTLADGYDPSTLTVTANGVALAGMESNGTYTYSFQANSDTEIKVSTPSKLTYTVVLPSGNFTAKFDDNTTSKTVTYGDDYSFTVTPHTGYKVLGIYVNGVEQNVNAVNGTYTVNVTSVTGPQTIYVDVAEIQTYTVTFVVPELGEYFTTTVAEGSTANKPVNPVKEGYDFGGWYTKDEYEKENGSKYTFADEVAGDLILYGKMTPKTYTVTYDLNGATGTAPAKQTKTHGEALTLSETVPTRTGYKFLGWATTATAAAASYQPGQPYSTDAAITLCAVWEQLTYTVTLPSGTGYSVSATQSTTVPYGENFTFTVTVDRDYAATAPTVTVGTLNVGSPTENGDGSKTYTYTITNITADQVVSVSVLKNSIYTVTYVVDNVTYQTAQVPYGEKAAQIAAPVKEGYTFSGWYSDVACQTAFNFSTAITGDTTIYGTFTAKRFTVTPPTDGTGWTFTAVSASPVAYGGSYSFTITVQEGYEAANMTVGVNGTLLAPTKVEGNVYYYTISSIQSDVVITVSGVARKTVTITYNDNGGTGGPVQQVVNYYLAGADNGTISSVIPTREGFTFQGWATTNNATTVEYLAGADADFTANTVLYAVWEAKGTSVTLAVSDYAGTVNGSTSADVNVYQYEGQTVTLTATVKDGANPVTSGSVAFYRDDDGDGLTEGDTLLGTVAVAGGVAAFQAETSAYSTAPDAANTDTYYAKFIPSGSYAEDTSDEVEVKILSTAITWKLEGGSMETDADKLTIISGSDTAESMTAGQTYTLKIPDVYALDGTTALTFGTDYTVTWEKKASNQDWESVGTGGQTFTVTSYQAGDVYRAKVYPAAPYTKAYGEDGAFTAALLTQATGAVAKQDTTTTIGVSKTSDVNGTTAQFEGETVLLYAQVFELNGGMKGDPIPSAGTVSFYRGEPEADQTNLLGTVDVSVLGFASLENVPISAYDPAADTNTDTFYAVFNGSDTYASSRTDGGEGAENAPVSVTIRSTAIAWTTENCEEQNKLLVYRGNSTKDEDRLDDQSGFTMLAGSTYTLKIPAVQEQGQDGVQLAYTTGYTITWYEIDKSGNTAEIAHTTGDTVVVTPATSGVRYYAEVHPAGNYTKAYQNGQKTECLTTDKDAQGYTSAEAGTVTDLSIAGAVNGAQYGGKTLILAASVKVKNPQGGDPLDNPVISQGTVTFYVLRTDADGNAFRVKIGNDAVDLTNGTASTTYTVPAYALDQGNVLYFYAVYSDVSTSSDGSTLYGGSNSTVAANNAITTGDIPADDQVQILSTAISWEMDGNSVKTSAITITDKATDTKLGDGDVMIAGKTYTLTIPEVYAFDQAAGAATALKAGADYTVTWQIQNAQGSWTIYNNLTGKTTDSVNVTPAESGANFRAVIYPAGGPTSVYDTAAVYANDYEGEVTGLNGQVLYSAPTTAIDQQATETTLTIMYADTEAENVWINGGTPFAESIGKHLAQFEGQTVTLEATVTANGAYITEGSVYFYRYVDGEHDEKLNAVPVPVYDSVARLDTATISAYDTDKDAVNNVDRFYAVYQANGAYAESASVEKNEETGAYQQPNTVGTVVYIKSATIDIPVITSVNAGNEGKTETTKTSDLAGLQSGVSHTFDLKVSAGSDSATKDYSVVALDGRAVDSNNYTIQWFTNTGNGEGAISGATTAEYQPANVESGDTFHIHLIPTLTGDMVKGVLANGNIGQYAESKKAIIGDRQHVKVTVTASDGIDSTTDAIDVYQSNTVTLTATVAPTEDTATAQPTGSVTFYYSVDGGATWTQLADAVNVESVAGKAQASLTTDKLPVEADGTHQTVTITAIYSGDGAFAPSGTIDKGAITITDGCEVTPVNVTVYSSVVYVNDQYQNVVTTVSNYEKVQGIVITGQLTANETAVLTLSDIYTKDYADVSDTLAKLAYGTDYTVQWQKLPNAAAYGDKVADAAGWEVITGAAGKTCSITVEDGAAYRAVVTVLDTAQAKGSYQNLDGADRTYYSNIVTSGKGDLTLTISTTSSNQNPGYEGIVEGETVTIRALMSGASSTTPIAKLTLTVKDGADNEVYTTSENSVSGVVAFQWTDNVTPGVYTITVKAEPSNGYAAKEVSKTVIVRDNAYTIEVTGTNKPYNGQTQGVAVAISGMDIESDLASKSWTVKYYADEARTQLVEPNQAGTYYYTATLPASAYWTEKSVKGTFTIAQREVTILDLVAQAKVYDGTTKANLQEIVLNGTISGDSIYAMGEGYTASAKGGATTLGVRNVRLLGDDAANYTLTNPTYTENFTIQRNQVQGAVAQGVTFAYTGQDITLSRDQIHLIDQQGNRLTNYEIYYYFNGEGLEKVSAMNRKGQYLVEAKPDQTNYKDGACALVQVGITASAGTLDTNFTSATIDITNTVETYSPDGNQGVTAAASNGTVTVSYYYDSSWQTAVPTDAGRYLVKAVASTGDTAYGLYTIVKARPDISLTLGKDTVTYDSALHNGTPTLTGDNGAEVYYSYAGDVTGNVAYQAPHDAGSYVVTAHVGETANYTAHEVSAVLTIDKAALTITADNLQRQQYSAYPDMVASYSGLATGGVAADTSLRDVQIQPEFNADWNNFALDHTGDYPITPVSALAKNYVITYVDGAYTVTYGDPNVTLAIHGLPESGNGETGLVYVGDEIQLYAYGTKMDRVTNGSSAIVWGVTGDNASITPDGLLTINGTGDITVTLTRGSGDTAISTSVPLTAARKEVQVDMADQTVTYSGSEQTYSGAVTAEGTVTKDNTTRINAGSQVVTAKVDDTTRVSETYGGLFTVEKKAATVTPNAVTTTYGTKATLNGYTVTDANALTDGQAVSIADAYNRLDVGNYEILVAGRENLNYAVSYQTLPNATVEQKELTITTGSYADNVGVTGGSQYGDYPAEGAIFDTSKTLSGSNIRMYGEPNWVMGYQIDGLVDGDSEADLAAALQKLVGFDFDIEAEANLDYQSKKLMNGKDNYTITSLMDFGNYTITVTEGTQNVYQRPVALQIQGGQTLSLLYAQLKDKTAAEQEAMVRELLLNNLSVEKYNDNGKLIGGLATLLGHTAQDLTYDIQINGSIDSGYTVTVQATGNYWSEETKFTVSVVKQGYVVEYHNDTFSATSMTVTLYLVNADGDRTAAYLPDDQLVLEIYKKLDEDENNRSYAYYQQQGAECLRRVTMTKVPGSTGLYTATYDKLPGGAYYRCFAIPSGSGYVIVG